MQKHTHAQTCISGDSGTLRAEVEDKGLDSNGDAEMLHAEAEDNLLDTIEEWKLQGFANTCTIEDFASVATTEEWELTILRTLHFPTMETSPLCERWHHRTVETISFCKR